MILLSSGPCSAPVIAKRIGMNSEYQNYNLEVGEYAKIKNAVDNYKLDNKVTSYTRDAEQRDLRRAYFGNQETSSCSLTSRLTKEVRYQNKVSVRDTTEVKQKQVESGAIIKDNLKVSVYDVHDSSTDYHIVTQSKKNNEAETVKKETGKYGQEMSEEKLLGLTPFATIKNSHFNEKFELLGNINKAVYGKIRIDGQEYFLIKEAKSEFSKYSTVGHSYKAMDNYFYEGLLKDLGDNQLAFTRFRFYHEFLILSQPADSEDVPVLYLDRPILVSYDEYRYTIDYGSTGDYDKGKIPSPTLMR